MQRVFRRAVGTWVGGNDLGSPWPAVSRERLERLDLRMYEIVDAIFAAGHRARHIGRDHKVPILMQLTSECNVTKGAASLNTASCHREIDRYVFVQLVAGLHRSSTNNRGAEHGGDRVGRGQM